MASDMRISPGRGYESNGLTRGGQSLRASELENAPLVRDTGPGRVRQERQLKRNAPLRLAAVYSHPVQYTAPLFRELGGRDDVDLTVYYLSRHGVDVSFDAQFGAAFKWDIPLLDGYKHNFVPNLRKAAGLDGFFKLLNVSIAGEILRNRYDALLVHGYEHFAKWPAFLAATGIARGISSERTARDVAADGETFRAAGAFRAVRQLRLCWHVESGVLRTLRGGAESALPCALQRG